MVTFLKCGAPKAPFRKIRITAPKLKLSNGIFYILTNNWLSLQLRSHDLEDADDVGNNFFYRSHIEQVQAILQIKHEVFIYFKW